MAYNLSFAGVTFRPPSPEIMSRIEQFDWLKDLRDVLPTPQVFPGPNLQRAGLPTPLRYPDVRIGDFFYPVGACRWSIFRGLMTADDITAVTSALRASTPTANTSIQLQGTFTIQSDGGDSSGPVSTQLFMLPPIPIMGGPAAPTVYLVNLVDERYFWQQWFNAGDTTEVVQQTWADYLHQLATQLNISLAFTTPASVYGIPEVDSPLCTTGFDNPAALLDLAAANVGCAVVRNLDGTYKLQRYADANAAAKSNLPASGNNLVGGPPFTNPIDTSLPPSYFVMLPATVRVVLPIWWDDTGEYYEEIGTSTTSLTVGLGAKTITVGSDLDFALGVRLRIQDASGNVMVGVAQAYDSGTGVFIVDVDAFAGSGTISSWTVYMTGYRIGYDDHSTGNYIEREYYKDSYPASANIDVATSSLGSPYTDYPTFDSPAAKVIRTTYKSRKLGPYLPNSDDCNNLAAQLAKDYLDSRLSWIDEAVAGIYPWPPEGVSDLLYCWRNGQAFTRVIAPPFNAGPTDFQHGIPVGGLAFCDEHAIQVLATAGDTFAVYQNVTQIWFDGCNVSRNTETGVVTVAVAS